MLTSLVYPIPHESVLHTACPGCHRTDNAHLFIFCVTCNEQYCAECIRGVYPSRDRLGICKRCPLPPSMAGPGGDDVALGSSVQCGRCGSSFAVERDSVARRAGPSPPPVSDTTAFFCCSCAAPICLQCLPRSFEAGRLFCSRCCRCPVHWQHAGIRQLIDETLLRELYSGASSASAPASCFLRRATAQANPKYRTLSGKTLIGKGGQATVYKCETADKEVVVSKEMTFDSNTAFEEQRRQAERMQMLSHTHLIRYLDVISDRSKRTLHIILPYYSKGDLKQLIFHHQGHVPVFKLCSLILQLTTALVYLHNQTPPLVHGDVKPENVLLLNNEEQVLLMDLDLCCEEDAPSSVSSSVTPGKAANGAYTCEYSAPEIRKGRRRTPKADIFSLGVVTYALAALPSEIFLMCKGDVRLLSDDAWEKDFPTLDKLIRVAIRRRSPTYPVALVDLIMEMLRYNPDERPTSSEVERRLSDIMMTLL